jgi:uncharacterized glyoxalase superfamily protein PhnB
MVNSAEDPDERTSTSDIDRGGHVTLYIWTKGVDELRTELQEQGVEVGEITIQYYGMKQLSVADPDGYALVFQESVK